MHKDFRVWPSLLSRCGISCPHFRRGYPQKEDKINWKLFNLPYCDKAEKGITLDDKHVNFPSFCPLEKPEPE